MINMQVRDSYNKIALSRDTAEDIWQRAMEQAKAQPSERGSRRNKGGGKKLRRTLLIAAVIASFMTVTALASEFYGFGSLVREEREQLMAQEQPDGSLDSSTVTVYDIGQTRPYEGPDWAMEWVDKAQEAFSEWRSYKEEKLEAYYREKLPNLKDILTKSDGPGYDGIDVQDNGDGTYTFTLWRYEEDPDNLAPDIFGNMAPAYKEVLDPATSVTVDQAEKEAFDEEMLRMATLGGYGDYHHIYGVADAEGAEKLEELAAEYGLSLRSGQVTKYAGDDSDEGLNQSLGQAVGSGDIYREAPEFDHYSTFQSGSFQSAANITLSDGRKLSTYLCSTAYGEMVDGWELGGFTVREDEPMSTRSYTAADGTELTISQNSSQAIVYAYLDKSYITMTMEINSYRSPGVPETNFSLDEAAVNYGADFINYKNIGK
ncbi:MAG TPA: hypothetical protein IAC00_01630 [Candidatus Limivicinus faecipullorum]|nr:hypothetical protein [Candidatus Limivicinus faecipullorum]